MPQRQNFQTVPHRDISKGIDQRSAPNAVKPGYAEDMRNMDTNSTGFVEKRTGYQGYKGVLPLRSDQVTVSSGALASFDFNPEINLLLTTSSPIVVYGEILQNGTGMVAVTSGSTTVTGSGTLFTTELSVGSVLFITDTGESQIVTAIASDTSLTVGAAFSTTDAVSAFTHRTTREYYWETFINDSRKTVTAGSSATFGVTHGAASFQVAASVVTAPTTGSLDNYTVIPDELVIDSVNTLDVTMDNTGSGSDLDFYVLTENTDNEEVVSYRSDTSNITSGTGNSFVGDLVTLTIPASEHGLPNLHVIPFVYAEKTANNFSMIIPESVTVDNSGDIVIVIEDTSTGGTTIGGKSTFEGQVVLIDVPGDQALEASFTAGNGKILEFSGIVSDFNFYSFFDQQGGNQIQVIPDSIFYDSALDKVTVTFDIDTSHNLKLVYTDASVKSNVITVDMTDYLEVISDVAPSVSLWGIPHADIIYQDSVPKGSWTNSIEEYSSQGNNRIVTGIGGVLCEEIGSGEGVTLPSFFSDMRRRTTTSKTIGPFFGEISGKARGIDGAAISSNAVGFSNITNNGDDTATFDLNLGARYGSLLDIILDNVSTGNDAIVVTNAGNDIYNGTHQIKSVTDTATYVTAASLNITSATVSEPSVTFTFATNPDAVAFHAAYLNDGDVWAWQDGGDSIFIMTVAVGGSALLDPGLGTTITVTYGTNITLSGPNLSFASGQNTTFGTEKMTLETPGTPASITVTLSALETYTPSEVDTGAMGSIQTDSLIMSEFNEDSVLEDLPFILNDTVVSTLFTTDPQVVGFQADSSSPPVSIYLNNLTINTLVPAAASINVKRTNATQPLTSVSHFVKGDTVSAKGYVREFQVLSVDATANTITLDESIELSDNPSDRSFLSVTGRWKTVEAPILNDRPLSYFDQNEVNNQDRLRGVSINDSIFYTNYNDDVMKYDGESIYRAGLPSWQPRTHSWVDADEAGIPVPKSSYVGFLTSDKSLNFATFPDLPSGVSEIYLEENGGLAAGFYTIKSVNETDNKIIIDTAVATDEGAGDITLPQQAAYYFKLQMIDRNNNLVASAVTDYQECIVEMTQSGKITHQLTGLPKFDVYDYDRVDLLMFRSRIELNASPPFYQVKRVPIDFELAKATNSIIITDTVPDNSLSPIPDDTVSIALKGAELPTLSDQPPRAKYMATTDSRLILGNIKGYNRSDVTLISDSGITEDNVLGNATVQVTDGTGDLTFQYFDLTNGTTGLNTTNNIEISGIDFTTNTTQFELTCEGSVGYDLTDKYIQLSSFFCKDGTTSSVDGTSLFTSTGRTRDSDVGNIIGWWKISSHTVAANDTLLIEYTHGVDADFTFSGTTNPIYMTFPNLIDINNVPVVAIPYNISLNDHVIVSDVVYDDTTTALEFTSAVNRGVRDLKIAFNRVMVEEESPWAYALSGATEGNGRILFESALPGKTLTVTVSEGGGTDLEIFVNNVRRASGLAVNGQTTVFPSRLLISSPNFPEMFDNPFGSGATESDSLLDINANDGQEITGMATFFADSTGASGHLESTLLVFKNKSIYAVNTTTRALQKLESMGQGCTVPDSISATQSGIMFANQSGVYKVDRRLQVTYVGKWLERYWKDEVGSTVVEESAIAFTDSVNRKYKLSVPMGTNTKNSETVVLDYVVEDQVMDGSWTVYDNIASTGWVQTNTNSYFGNYTGQVFGLRQAGDKTDYRDDASSISASFIYGAQSFGDTGSRAVVNRIISHFRAETDITAVDLSVATDMSSTFTATDSINFVGSDPKLRTIATSIPDRHGLYFQVKYVHNTKDENMILSGIDYKVQGIGELGITQATDN